MRSFLSVALVALSATAASVPAFAQVQTPLSQSYGNPSTIPAAPAAVCQANISKDARKALIELQTAVVAKDAATIPAKLAEAQAKAKTADDKCFVGQLQMKEAADRGDLKAVAAALEVQLASGSMPAATIAEDYEILGRKHYNAKAFAEAEASFARALQVDPARTAVVALLADARAKQNRAGDALPEYQKAIAADLAAGRKPDESLYKRALTVAYNAKNPLAYQLARDWVGAYPSAANWRDAIRAYTDISGRSDKELIDMFRLARLTKGMAGDRDYGRYALAAIDGGFAGEAKAMLEEGFAANAIDRNKDVFKKIMTEATKKSAGDRASLDGQAATARAGAAARPLMSVGEAYYGYGDYAKAAAMFRAAQGKAGVDAELANLRLGMALLGSGDKAGAKAAFELVKGSRADIARYWLTYLASRP